MNLVYYSQEDPRWTKTMYSNVRDPKQTIGLSGCGPTSCAMVYSSLTGKTMLPPEAAKFAVDRGHRTSESGTSWTLFPDFAKAHGLECAQVFNLAAVKSALNNGALVIASMGPGHFTRSGHFIVLIGAHGGLIDVMDPNHINTNYKNDGLVIEGKKNDGFVSAKESVFVSEARSYWIIKLSKEAEDEMSALAAVEELQKKVDALYKAIEKVKAPAWFVKEFGSADLGGLITDPYLTSEGWRTLAIGLRVKGVKP